MTPPGLEKLFDGLAEDVKQYDVRDAVLRQAARRRRVVRLAPVAVAMALVLGVGAVWIPLHHTHRAPAAGPPAAMSWLPREVDANAATTPLPADRPVGPGAMLYRSRQMRPGSYALLTVDGGHYEVPQPITTLSPDGRWLGYRGKDGYVLRDLTSTTVTKLPTGYMPVSPDVPGRNGTIGFSITNRFDVREWSSDNRWLLLAEDHVDERAPEFRGPFYRYDLTTGKAERIVAPGKPDSVQAVLPSGDVLVEQLDYPGKVVTVVAVDPVTGAQQSRTTIDMNEYIPAAGYLQHRHVSLDGAAYLVPWTDRQGGPIKAVYVDLSTGQRRPLDIRPRGEKDWWVHTIRPEGVVTATRKDNTTFVLRLVDPVTGEQRILSTLRNVQGDMYSMQVRGT